MGIRCPGSFGKDCFDMLKSIGFGDFVIHFSSSGQSDRVYLGLFVWDLVGRLFRIQAWRRSVRFHRALVLLVPILVYLCKSWDPYVSPGCYDMTFLWVFLPSFSMVLLSVSSLFLHMIWFVGRWISFLDSLFLPGCFFWPLESMNVAGVLQEAGDADSRACTRSQV